MPRDLQNIPFVSELTKLSIDKVLSDAISSTHSAGAKKKIEIKYQLPETKQYVLGDREQLLKVATNLITNAIRFGSQGDKVIIEQDVIHGKRHNDINDFVRVAIRISGLGISKEMFDIVIEKFQNLTELLNVKPPKTLELELSYSQQVIKNLGGNIWVKSQFGRGLTFYFTIPLVRKAKKPTQSKKMSIVENVPGSKDVTPVDL
ncbi:MAG: sensor histidine kinase [bacterium]